jgi:hypothetical protein
MFITEFTRALQLYLSWAKPMQSTSFFIQKVRQGLRLIDPFHNEFVFYGEGLLAPRPTPKLVDHPLLFVRGCLFNIFAVNLQLEAVPSIRNPRTRHAVVTRVPT